MSYSAEVAGHCNNNANLAFSGVSQVSLRATSLVQTHYGTSFRLLGLSQQGRTGVLLFCRLSRDVGGRRASSRREGRKRARGWLGQAEE